MKFIWRYLWNKMRDIGNEPDECVPTTKAARLVGASSRDVDSDNEGLNITVRSAVGGRILSFRHHDAKTDRYTWKTYIVPEDMDFERELGKMITLESMRL